MSKERVGVVQSRVASLVRMASEAYHAGAGMSAATKGRERECFLESFLKHVFPPSFRWGTGDVVDVNGTQSGQLDIVVEVPTMFSLPVTQDSPRLYFAEGVAAAIEVKSNLSTQWHEVEQTAAKLNKLVRVYRRKLIELAIQREQKSSDDIDTAVLANSDGKPSPPNEKADAEFRRKYKDWQAQSIARLRESLKHLPPDPPARIPLYAVGFTGWKDVNPLQEKAHSLRLAGALVLDSQLFCSAPMSTNDLPGRIYSVSNGGPASMLQFMASLAYDLQVVSEYPNPMERFLVGAAGGYF